MSKAFKTAGSVGAVALILSGAAMAAAPFNEGFDQWTAASGTVTLDYAGSTCPSGFTCASAVTGEGFYQRQITDAGGNDYFQTIITDKTATGAPGELTFSDESYVRTGNVSGLADKTQMLEASTNATLTTTFIGSTELGTGWANAAGGAGSGTANDVALIYQAIEAVDTAVGAEDFDARFWLRQTGTEGVTGKHMRISSAIDIQEDVSQPGTQDFVLVELSGSESAVGGTIGLGAGGTISWDAGNRIKAIWVGQDMSKISGVQQEFGFTAYEDFTTSPGIASSFSLLTGSSSAPVSWTTPDIWGAPTAGTTGPF